MEGPEYNRAQRLPRLRFAILHQSFAEATESGEQFVLESKSPKLPRRYVAWLRNRVENLLRRGNDSAGSCVGKLGFGDGHCNRVAVDSIREKAKQACCVECCATSCKRVEHDL